LQTWLCKSDSSSATSARGFRGPRKHRCTSA
jgi:hypothetical protein